MFQIFFNIMLGRLNIFNWKGQQDFGIVNIIFEIAYLWRSREVIYIDAEKEW